MSEEIAVNLLLPHPLNCNRMSPDTMAKLHRHIERSGKYEPLTVRPHPHEKGRFQVINGHHRLQVLRSLGRRTASCVVWDVDDDQTALYLATLNRLGGEDVPERRAVLLDSLMGSFDVDELSTLLAEGQKELEGLLKSVELDLDSVLDCEASEDMEPELPVILDFMLEQDQATDVDRALELAIDAGEASMSRGEALVAVCRLYVRQAVPAAKP